MSPSEVGLPWLCRPKRHATLPWCSFCAAQSWEEKERLSLLYEEERERNLANPTKIRSVMQVGGV